MGALNCINPCSYIIFVYNDSLTNSVHMGLHVKSLLRNRALPDTDRDDPDDDVLHANSTMSLPGHPATPNPAASITTT